MRPAPGIRRTAFSGDGGAPIDAVNARLAELRRLQNTVYIRTADPWETSKPPVAMFGRFDALPPVIVATSTPKPKRGPMPPFADLTGMRSGSVVGKEFTHRDAQGCHWSATCDCGKEFTTRATDIWQGRIQYCSRHCPLRPIEVGLTQKQREYRLRRASGLCGQCGEPAAHGTSNCQFHLDMKRDRENGLRAARRARAEMERARFAEAQKAGRL